MNDMEKLIEDKLDEEEIVTQEKPKKRKNDKVNKKIIIIGGVVVGILLIVLLVYFIFKDDNKKEQPIPVTKSIIEEKNEEEKKDEEKTAYVSCTDNTSLLNVRKEPEKDIIDGLSCYQEVVIVSEEDKTDNCDKWYQVEYTKGSSSLTGYVCSTYIEEDKSSTESKKRVKELINKANDYYENNILKAFCGDSSSSKTIEYTKDNMTMTGEYVKSEYDSLDELKEYLLSFLDESLINPKLELSSLDNKEYYDNYYEIDGSLYCRNYAGKGWLSYYTGNYNYIISEETDDKIIVNISYQYLNEESSCQRDNLSNCSSSNFNYQLGKIIISKKDNKYIITKMDFHD